MCRIAITFGVITLLMTHSTQAETTTDVQFNTDYLVNQNGNPLDLSRFERGDSFKAGEYRLDVYVNNLLVEIISVKIDNNKNYYFTLSQIRKLGVDIDKLPDSIAKKKALENENQIDVTLLVPDSKVEFDTSNLRINLSIPQAYLTTSDRNYVPPSRVDAGVNAAFVDYNTSMWNTDTHGEQQTQYYAGINAGVNMGGWRVRHSGNYSQSSGANALYTTVNTYMQRDIVALKSQLTLGEYYTQSDLFDSVAYSGIQLAFDDRMLPDSLRGYAPIVRGTAQTNAKVTVRQGGNILIETSVAPGPFAIDGLSGSGYAGDLAVTVTEADGRERSFTVPFASVSQLMRPGFYRYSLVLGKYRDDRLSDTPEFLQATYQKGLDNRLTGYTGAIAAENYQSVLGGVGMSTPFGALAADVTHSIASDLAVTAGKNTRLTGQSYRLGYSKLVESTQTNFTLAAYRFSSDGYMSLADYSQSTEANADNFHAYRQRSRLQTNISQTLGEGIGSIYLNGSIQNYWHAKKSNDMSYQAGYSNAFRWGSLNVTVSRTYTQYGENDTQYRAGVSIPLGNTSHSPFLTSSMTHSQSDGWATQAGLSGIAGKKNQLSYSAYGTRSQMRGDSFTDTGGNLQYRASNAGFTGNVSKGKQYRQFGLGVTGSMVAHPGGINFSQEQGETKAIIKAQGAMGANLLNSNGAKVGSNGYAVVSGLTPYRENTLSLDPKGLTDDIELSVTEQSTAPGYGAIVMLDYPTVSGQPVLLKLIDDEGKNLPIGAEVMNLSDENLTFVGQGSRVFLRVQDTQGQIKVWWGKSADHQCIADYTLPKSVSSKKASFLHASAICHRIHSKG